MTGSIFDLILVSYQFDKKCSFIDMYYDLIPTDLLLQLKEMAF